MDEGTNLALSGGGFRATLFHVGALWRLNELGVLIALRRVASVSGGSIAAAYLGLVWSKLEFDGGVATAFQEQFVDPLRRFCAKTVDLWAIAKVLPAPWRWTRSGNALEGAYRTGLFGRATLQDLPHEPRFLILSTNLVTGATFRFSRETAGDYLTGVIRSPSFLLSEAVAASSAFPPVLSPFALRVDPTAFEEPTETELPWPASKTLYLSDAGVIDNLGLEPLATKPGSLLVSDAGAPAGFDRQMPAHWIALSKRTVDIAIYQALPARKRALINNFANGKAGTYWAIRSEISDYGLADCLDCPASVTNRLAKVRTRLNSFSEPEQCQLINWGYAVCDAAMRRHVLVEGGTPPPKWPYAEYALDRLPTHAQDVNLSESSGAG